MNKGNKLLLIVLSFIVVCLIGYALFSETITINGTATAKGNFDITASCAIGDTYDVFPAEIDDAYNSEECSVKDNIINYKVNLTMPTALRKFTFTFKNTGSIPATLNASTGISMSADYCRDTDRDGLIGDSDWCDSDDDNAFTLIPMPVGVITVNGTFISTEESGFSDFIDVDGQSLILQPNESLVALGGFGWPDSYDRDEYNNTLISLGATAVFNFEQVTTN